MALGNYKIKVVPVLDTASLHSQLEGAGVSSNLKKAGASAGAAYSRGLFGAIKERAKYSVANALIYGSINAMKDMVANVRELDKAQVELKKVTDLSGKSLDKFTEQAYKMSGAVAKTGTEIIQASTEFAKQGFDPQTALQLSNVASQFQNIADTEIDAATAAKFINSQLKAFGNTDYFSKFNTDAEKATAVIDAVNEVANNFGVGTNDLQMALTKTSAAMKGYGNTYSETIGLITAGTEVMPNQASKVARGWRTIGANILKLAQDTDTLEAANGKVSVALKDSNGELRSTFQILQDLYPQWKTLNSEERSALALSLAGKTQTEVFQATMDNFTHAIEANETAMNSQGSAARENAKYLDSIQGRVKAFQSAWEQLSYHIISSDLIKNVVSLGTKIIKVIDNLVQGIGALPTAIGLVATAFGALKLAKLIPQFLGLSKVVEEVVVAENALTTASTGVVAAEEAMATASGGSLLSRLASLGSALLPLAPALLALGGAFIYANHQYKNSFKGKLEEYQKLGDEIENIKSQIDELESKEGSLTSEEESRLSILKMQLKVLEQQEQLKSKQLTNAFNKDAKEKMHGKKHMENGEVVTEREDLTGDKYIKAAEKRFELQKKIKHLEDESRMHPLTEEQTKALEKYNKELDKVYDNEYNALEKLIEEHDQLANVDYSQLTADGKAWYDNTHSAYLQALSDVESVREAVGNAIDTFGSAQFDAWDIDVSSLESADDLIAQIKEKIDGMDDDEEITFRVKNDDGSFNEVTKKKSELTEEDMEAIIHFNETGIGEVDAEADNAARTRDSVVKVVQEGAQTVSDIVDDASKDRDTTVHVSQEGAGAVQDTIDNIKGKDVHVNIFKTVWESVKKLFAKGKRKGEPGGMAWLGDEGTASNPKPELVVGEDGAYLAGTSGWELHSLKDSDTVYSYSETKKLLGGRQSFIGSVGELPRYKKGKISNKTKKKKREEFDNKLKALEHKRKVNHWTDKKYQNEYKKLYNKYKKYLKKDQRWDYSESKEDYENERDIDQFKERAKNILTKSDLTNFRNAVNKNKNLTADEKAELIQDAGNAYASSTYDRRLGNLSIRGADNTNGQGARLSSFLADVKKSKYLSKAEKAEYAKKAYQEVAEYNLKEYKNGVKTRAETLQSIKDYYNQVGNYDETYYKMLDELREADKDKELDRLKTLKEAQDNSLTLAQKYLNKELSRVKKQIEADKEEADQLERITDLEKELAKAKSKKIRVYKEGVGFVYEQDVEAVHEAEKALNDYKKSLEKTPLEQYAEQLESVLDLFDELADASEIKELELALGVGSLTELTGGNLGTNLSAWTKWISQKYANSAGYADLIEQLGNVATSQITDWLTASGNTEVSSSLVNQYLNKHSFASGVLSAPGGLSRVGEKLKGELVWLGKGDSVYSNAVSKNLMEWGRYSPAQFSNTGTPGNQIFNFDKIVLPNVHNAETFYRELQNLPNKALQQSTMRV